MTLDELVADPLKLNRTHVPDLARPENVARLCELLHRQDEHLVSAAARLLGVIGDPAAVDSLTHVARGDGNRYDALDALAECGAEGRAKLAELCREPGDIGEIAVESLKDGLSRPEFRAALFKILEGLASQPDIPLEVAASASRRLILHGWISSWPSLPGRVPDGLRYFPAFLPAASRAVDRIPTPRLAQCVAHCARATQDCQRRSQRLRDAFVEELESRVPDEKPSPRSLGRNEPCWCGSQKKYKKCCYEKDNRGARVDPWVLLTAETGFIPTGLARLPFEFDDLLGVLQDGKPARLRVRAGDGAPKAWIIATRLFECEEWEHGLDALVHALEAPDRDALDVSKVLTWTLCEIAAKKAWAIFPRLIPLLVAHGEAPHLRYLGGRLAGDPDELYGLFDELVARHAPFNHLLALVYAALKDGADEGVAEEFFERRRAFYEDVPGGLEVDEELRGLLWDAEGAATPFPQPHPAAIELQWLERLPLEQFPDLLNLREMLRALLTFPNADVAVTPDSQAPLEAELSLRRQRQFELSQEIRGELLRLRREMLDQSALVWAALTPRSLVWLTPPDMAHSVAAAAGRLQAEMGLAAPRVGEWEGRMALVQRYDDCALSDLDVAVSVILAETHLEGKLTVLEEPLLETSTRSQELTQRAAASATDCPRYAGWVAESVDLRAAGLPVSLDDDQCPARRALRRVLRRLLRLNKVGEAHTAVELVSRGVRGHLRGQVRESVDVLLARGILRDKPTLKGQHTSIEPKHLPRVERFIQEGWLPHSDLGPILGIP